jgi:hypothetical protein
MSRILKRPMFRRGGEVGGGIMTGIRQNFAEAGSARDKLLEAYAAYPVQSVDPVAKLLISGGLRGLSTTGGGGTLGNLAKAFQEPTERLFEDIGAQDKARRDLAMVGTKMDIESEQAQKLALIKAREESKYQKEFSPERKQYELYSAYTDPKNKSFTTTVQQDFPRAMSDYGSYMEQAFRQNKIDVIDVLPHKKRGNVYDWEFDKMIPGGLYFKPDTKKLYQRDAEKNILIEYDPYSFKKIRDIPLKKTSGG